MPRLSTLATSIAPAVFAQLQPIMDARRTKGQVIYPLHIGDVHYAPPASVELTSLVQNCFANDIHKYASTDTSLALRNALAKREQSRCHPSIEIAGTKHVHVTTGATHALLCAARATLDPGDQVLVVSPYWPLAPGVLQTAGLVPVEVPLTQRLFEDPSLDIKTALQQAWTPNVRALYCISPNNPDGFVYSHAQLQAIVAFAASNDLWIYADEVYAAHPSRAPAPSFLSIQGAWERTLVLHSFSKSHALAGSRIGALVAHERLLPAIRRIATHTVFHPTLVAQAMALAAITDDTTFRARSSALYTEGLEIALESLPQGVRAHVPQGASYLFVQLESVLRGRSSTEFLQTCAEHGVILAPGRAFGTTYESFARLCFTAVEPAVLREAMAALSRAIDSQSTKT